MAGDWIKMRTNLDTDPRVCEIAAALNLSELHVVGCLWKLWSWADQHTLDGNDVRVTKVTLDRFVGVTGFADALRNVGWLAGRDSALTFPRFSEHNGQTAKTRALTAKRVAKHKSEGAKTGNDKVTLSALPREEKRREEKSIKKTNSETAFSPYLKDKNFAAAFERFKQSSRVNHHWTIAESTAEAWLMQLASFPIEDATAMLNFSTSKGAKTPITNGDHNASSRRASSGSPRQSPPNLEECVLK